MNEIKCPSCGHLVDVDAILSHQAEERLQKEYAKKADALWAERQAFAKTKAEENNLFQERVKSQLATERAELESKIKHQVQADQAGVLAGMQKELQDKSKDLQDFNKAKADLIRVEREKDELRGKIELEAEHKITIQLTQDRERIRKEEEERNSLKLKELQEKLDAQARLTDEMRRKQEQGLTQLQGEVQELAIEEWLKTNFPLDSISEVKKGQFGADCVQVINTRSAQNVGSIYYESKRTKSFEPAWIEKLKGDMLSRNATFGVLVTETLPKDQTSIGQRNGIWIVSLEQFRGICFVLRESAIMLHSVAVSQENKGGKMEMLYNFLTSPEFASQISAIVEGFTTLQTDLEKERRAMESIWKQREKQIQRVVLSTTHMYSSIRGIAGASIASVPQLELHTPPDQNMLLI